MKSIAVVLILFGLVATGIGVYFIRQSSVASTVSQAAENESTLRSLFTSNCDYIYLPDCPLGDGAKLQISVPTLVEATLQQSASQEVLRYSEPVNNEVFSGLGMPNVLMPKSTYTVSEIISRVSLSSNVNYKVLIALFRIQGRKAWDGTAPLSNPFGRRELSFADQMAGMAYALKVTYDGQVSNPTPSLVKGNKVYEFPETMNIASRSMYVYLSRIVSDEQFEELVAPPLTNGKSFLDTWYLLYPNDVLKY